MRSITEGLDGQPTQESTEASSSGIRTTLNGAIAGPAGMVVLAVIAAGLLLFVFSQFKSVSGADPTTTLAARVRLLNPQNGNMTWHTIELGKKSPEGLYPVEYCWNNHGEELAVPVILNSILFAASDPRHDEPTVCPCCGSPVTGRNPKPHEFSGMTPKDQRTGQTIDCVIDHYRPLAGG